LKKCTFREIIILTISKQQFSNDILVVTVYVTLFDMLCSASYYICSLHIRAFWNK